MHQQRCLAFIVGLLALSLVSTAAVTFDRYHKPEELRTALEDFARANPGIVKIHELAKSPGGRAAILIEIGPETGKKDKSLPAVFVGADFEGTNPLSGEAAVFLAKLLLEKPQVRKDLTWYILPCGNPDAAVRYFARPLLQDSRNGTPHNDDLDDATDEDGPEDLNGDGLITQMRARDPAGEWIPVPGEPRLMKRADWSKGEKGIYKLYSEGVDNDGDGEINEDGAGGVNIGVQFPHLFKFFTASGGIWSGSEPESFALLKFFDEHREIGLTFVFGETNFCLLPPRGGRQGEADFNQIKLPPRMAEMLAADPNKTYSMAEIMEMAKSFVPQGMEVTEAMVASFLDLGAVVNPLPEDLKFYRELSEKYKEFLKKNKLDMERVEPEPDQDGSFELWSYYHLGLPSFSLNFWSLPKVKEEKKADEITPEKLEKMTNEEFIALGEEKIDAFLKSAGAPGQFSARQVIDALKGGMMDTRRMAEMLRQMPKPPGEEGIDPEEKALLAFSDKELGGKGFVAWTSFNHPTLGEVEIGGEVPFTRNTPPPQMISALLEGQVPWVLEIAGRMPRMKIGKSEVKPLGGGVYSVEVWVENSGYLPYPTAMGRRNSRVLPVVVTLEGQGFQIIDGKKRSLIKSIDGSQARPVRWLVRAEKPVRIMARAATQTAWGDVKSIDLGRVK